MNYNVQNVMTKKKQNSLHKLIIESARFLMTKLEWIDM